MLGQIDASVRAKRAVIKIQRKPSTIVFTKPEVTTKSGATPETPLPPQVVRINADNKATVIDGTSGMTPKRAVIVFGVVGHPSEPDNDIAVGYTFQVGGANYRVSAITPNTPGEIQAEAVEMG